MLAVMKYVVDDNFVFQQHSAPWHGSRDTVQLLQRVTLNFISPEPAGLPTAHGWTQLITRFWGNK